MTSFLNGLRRETNLTRTENGAVTNKSSLDPIVDFFGLAGAMRNTPQKAADLFELAYQEDIQTAVRTLFYLRDIRGGQGEREVFRACLRRLLALDEDGAYRNVVEHVPFYGRWDDLFHSGVISAAMDVIRAQWDEDVDGYNEGDSISLLAKWMPSENASSPKTKALAYQVREALGLSSRDYRQTLSALRGHIRLLEHDMSSNSWDNISFQNIPSQAHRRHTKAFHRHQPERYQNYLDSVQRGEAKMNVKDVYPHEIYTMVTHGQTAYANAAWDSLPDYTNGENALVMADVSGSMVRSHQPNNPIAVSVSLALYFAERNRGPFKDHFMTFSGEPTLVRITGDTLQQKMRNIAKVGYLSNNTNLLAAFRAILRASLGSPQDTPKVLYVISDMEFDSCTTGAQDYQVQTHMVRMQDPWGRIIMVPQQIQVPIIGGSKDTVFETAKREFAAAGLTLPHVVFWNVQARQAQAPALSNDGHVSLVSGLSPTIFSQAVQGKTPRELVDEVVNAERYQRIVL